MKQRNSEVIVTTSNWLILVLSLSVLVIGVMEKMHYKYILIFLIIAIDMVYYQTVINLYKTIKKVSHVIDEMVDNIIEDRVMQVSNQIDDGVFSKICDKLNKLYDAKVLVIKNAKEEISTTHELISDISHQVKTPIANIKIYTEMLERRLNSDEELYYLRVMKEQVNKLEFLMQSLIKMSRLETNIISLKIEERKLLDIIASALDAIIPRAEKKNICLQTDCVSGIMVLADYKWTVEAIFNILDNAVKYTAIGGNIQIKTALLESYVSLEIIDNGIGMNQEEIPLIFKRFYRGDSVQEKEGLGLGLALVRKIITMEHGYVTAISEAGKGSCFRVMLLRGNT